MLCPKRNQRGVTILEILVALILFVIVLLGTTAMLVQSRTMSMRAQRLSGAVDLADMMIKHFRNAGKKCPGLTQSCPDIFPDGPCNEVVAHSLFPGERGDYTVPISGGSCNHVPTFPPPDNTQYLFPYDDDKDELTPDIPLPNPVTINGIDYDWSWNCTIKDNQTGTPTGYPERSSAVKKDDSGNIIDTLRYANIHILVNYNDLGGITKGVEFDTIVRDMD